MHDRPPEEHANDAPNGAEEPPEVKQHVLLGDADVEGLEAQEDVGHFSGADGVGDDHGGRYFLGGDLVGHLLPRVAALIRGVHGLSQDIFDKLGGAERLRYVGARLEVGGIQD